MTRRSKPDRSIRSVTERQLATAVGGYTDDEELIDYLRRINQQTPADWNEVVANNLLVLPALT